MPIRLNDVMLADVEELRITWRKGWSSAGVSKFLMSTRWLVSSRIEKAQSMCWHTFAPFEVASQPRESQDQGVVLYGLSFLASQTPSSAQALVFFLAVRLW